MKHIILLLTFLTIIGCEKDQYHLNSPINTRWTLTAIQNTSTNAISYYPETIDKESVVFYDSLNIIRIKGVCNGCAGNYSINSNIIKVNISGCTQIFCNDVDWEGLLCGNLDSAYMYKMDSKQLTLYSKGKYNLIFSAN